MTRFYAMQFSGAWYNLGDSMCLCISGVHVYFSMLFPGFGSLFLIFPGALEACTWCSGACLLGERHKLRQSRLCHQLITPDHGATSLYNFHMLPSLFTWKIFLPPLKLQFDRAGAGALGCSWPVHAWSKTCLKRFSSLWSWTLLTLIDDHQLDHHDTGDPG